MFRISRRQLVFRDVLQQGDLRLNLLLRQEVFSLQCRQLAPAKSRPLAEFNQLVVVSFGEVSVSNLVTATPLNLRPVPLGGLEVVRVIRVDIIQFPKSLGLHLDCPGRQIRIYPRLQPLVHILPGLFQRRTLRMLFLDVCKEVFYVLPIGFIGVNGKYLMSKI